MFFEAIGQLQDNEQILDRRVVAALQELTPANTGVIKPTSGWMVVDSY